MDLNFEIVLGKILYLILAGKRFI